MLYTEAVKNMTYCIGTDRKNHMVITATAEEIIQNALEQEKEGIEPIYRWYNDKTGKPETPPGWLVWSSMKYGCGIVYRRKDGKLIIRTGLQGDFCC